MKLPRDLSGRDFAKALSRLGYAIEHETGSHLRLATARGGVHSVTIPDHDSLRIGTLSAIIRDIGLHLGISRNNLLEELFG